MFSTSVGRIARSTNSIASGCAVAFSKKAAPACGIAPQRRLSSTKTTISTEERGRKLKEQEEKLKLGGDNVLATQTRAARSRKKAKAVTVSGSGSYPDVRVPSVPSTEHIPASHFCLASIFSQHRPVSITTSIPTSTTPEAFNSIFEPLRETEHKPEHVMLTLGNAIDRLDQATQRDLSWKIVQESPDGQITHLDGAPKSVSPLPSQFTPFTPPPPPAPWDVKYHKNLKKVMGQKREPKKRLARAEPQSKVWSTTVVVTEYTNRDGSKTWSAQTTPIVQEPDPISEAADPAESPSRSIQQPFLQRMRQRQERVNEYRHRRRQERPGMFAISVKRQRKLKMKKHKYKKLMKRTRNLRRRLDRN